MKKSSIIFLTLFMILTSLCYFVPYANSYFWSETNANISYMNEISHIVDSNYKDLSLRAELLEQTDIENGHGYEYGYKASMVKFLYLYPGICSLFFLLSLGGVIVFLIIKKELSSLVLIPSGIITIGTIIELIVESTFKMQYTDYTLFGYKPLFGFYFNIIVFIFGVLFILNNRFHFVEKLVKKARERVKNHTPKPTDKERIAALEAEIARMKDKNNQF